MTKFNSIKALYKYLSSKDFYIYTTINLPYKFIIEIWEYSSNEKYEFDYFFEGNSLSECEKDLLIWANSEDEKIKDFLRILEHDVSWSNIQEIKKDGSVVHFKNE